MKKLKLLVLGTAMVALSSFAVAYFGAGQAEANPNPDYCEWDGEDCLSPSVTNYCICEDGGAVDQ
ncbi:hypothetical protein J0A68_05595 [Algoriphagus sp. H41]|uniref:Secreted protein n=1 Tax=Algoriphagus oliviformis TaxID=2811231 RepID=A0ABS3BZY7_9BACT|nr:hypothetical protein [Algoriphagus oliviformis]MBN7810418.1 hypothetical protein [Algoriphagus oliviformis]